MAPLAAPGGPAKHHPRAAAVQVPGAEPGREHLAVHARELALEPHLHVLQRPPRPLLCSLEQARRPALAYHDHRPARLGISVLINEAWYYTSWPSLFDRTFTARHLPPGNDDRGIL